MLRQDDVVVTSLKNVRQYQNTNPSYQLGVAVNNVVELEPAIDEAMLQMRKARKLIPTESDNFIIDKSDKFAQLFLSLIHI